MTNKELKDRTQLFALRIMKFVDSLPSKRSAEITGRQLLRSATSVGANYRAACRAQSYAHFISKIGTVEEEADESLFWLELIVKAGLTNEKLIKPLLKEADELTAIFTATRKTAKMNKNNKPKN